MKVFCICEYGWFEDYKLLGIWSRERDVEGPAYGDIVTVAGQYYEKGILFYYLIEWPPCTGENGFQSDCFIPLSDIDERELVNEEFEIRTHVH